MKRLTISLFSVLALATLLGAAPSDPLYARLLGTWSCTTAAGSSVVQTYDLSSSGAMTMHLSFHQLEGWAGGRFDASFAHDPAGKWITTNHGYGLTFNGTSPGINGDDLLFEGTQSDGSNAVPTREHFHFVSDKQFEHQWLRQGADGRWRVTSHAMCYRR